MLTHVAALALLQYNGQTPLHWAVYDGRAAVVQLLLERGAVVDSRSNVRRPVVPRSEGGRAAFCSSLATSVHRRWFCPPDAATGRARKGWEGGGGLPDLERACAHVAPRGARE